MFLEVAPADIVLADTLGVGVGVGVIVPAGMLRNPLLEADTWVQI